MSHATKGEEDEAQQLEVKETTIPIFATSPSTSDFSLHVSVNETLASCLIDTGAAMSLISKQLWDRMKEIKKTPPLNRVDHKLVGVQGVPLKLYGTMKVEVKFNGMEKMYPVEVQVAESITTDIILGRDFLQENHCNVKLGEHNQLHFTTEKTTINFGRGNDRTTVASVDISIAESVVVPPLSEMEIMVQVPQVDTPTTWLMEPNGDQRHAVVVARAVVDPRTGRVPVRILNPRAETVTVHKGSTIAVMEPLLEEDVAMVASVSKNPEVSEEKQRQLWQTVSDVGKTLSLEEQKQLYAVLLEHADLFATGPDDFGRTGKIKHGINTGDTAPVRQQVRRIPPVRREEARKLLSEMLKKDVIQPSSSPWASPIVLVPKKDGAVRFCVDYRKVNALTRKDAYPLP